MSVNKAITDKGGVVMHRFLRTSLIAFIFCVLFISTPLFADEFYDAAGFNPNRETFTTVPNEYIDTFTGGVILNYVDVRLPGNGGLDLVIQRTFNSKKVCKVWYGFGGCQTVGNNSWMGLGWTLHFGRVIDPYGANPIIEMPDGSQHKLYAYINDSTKKITKDYWLYEYYYDASHPLYTGQYVVTFTDGRKIYFAHQGPQVDGKTTLYAIKMTDVNGNTINIYYKQPYAMNEIIDYIDDSVERRIYFYTTTVNSGEKLTSISGPGVNFSYTHNGIPNWGYSYLVNATPPVGNSWTYSYDSATNDLSSLTSPVGGTISYQYNLQKFIISSQDFYFRVLTQRQTGGRDMPAGTWNFSYQGGSSGDTTTITDSCGRTITYQYYGYGYSSTYGNVWRIGLPISKSISGEETINYTWDKSDAISYNDESTPYGTDYYIWVPRITSKSISRDGQTYATNYSGYDFYGNPGTISESSDKSRTTSVSYWYDTSKNIVHNKPSSETVSGGFSGTVTTNYLYDSNTGNLTQVNKYGVTTNYSYYSSNGNLYSMTDANTHTTTYEWNYGRISRITNPIYSISRVINPNGTITNETNGRGYTTYFTYDGNLRLTRIDPTTGNPVYFNYPSDNSYKQESRGGSYIYYYYDGFGRPSGTSDSKGVTTDIVYKACGPKNYSTSNIGDTVYYDNFGRATSAVHQDSTSISYSYSGSNVTMRNEINDPAIYTYNAFGEPDEKFLVAVNDPAGNTTSYDRNILGSLTSSTQGGITRSFNYNLKNFLDSETHPETGTITYTRDNVGNMTSKTDALGTKNYSYDSINRLTTINYGTETITFDYDTADNRTSMTNPSASITYDYDVVNRLTQKAETIAGRTYTTTYDHDGNDNTTDIYYPSARHVTYGYNSNNQVTSITGFGGSVSSVSYNTAGLPTAYTFSNGIINNITYNNRNFTTRITAGTALDVGYGYDSRGNTSPITNYLDTTKNQTFTYDSLSRVTEFNGAWGTGSYTYDSIGNRQSKQIAGVTTNYTYSTSTNRLDYLSGGEPATFSYNGYGSLTGTSCSGGNTLTYDMLNNLKEYKFGAYTLASYGYDGDGMRVTKTTWKTIVYHYDKDGRTLSETDSSGNLIADNIYLNGKLVAKAEPSSLYFYHTDPAGTPLAMTNTSGTVIWKTDYKPFGEEDSITGTIENNEKFVGKEKDKETGLYYFGARYLGPKIGRFITVDPAGIKEKDLLNPQKLNRYAYSLNNPYRYVDPDGREVRVIARRLNISGVGSIGVHTFIQIKPDNPKDFKGEKRWVLGGYEKGGRLTSEKSKGKGVRSLILLF